MYQPLEDEPQTWPTQAEPGIERKPGSTMPYAEAREAWERRQIDERAIKDAYARDCAGRQLFERLERDPGTAETRVKRFEIDRFVERWRQNRDHHRPLAVTARRSDSTTRCCSSPVIW